MMLIAPLSRSIMVFQMPLKMSLIPSHALSKSPEKTPEINLISPEKIVLISLITFPTVCLMKPTNPWLSKGTSSLFQGVAKRAPETSTPKPEMNKQSIVYDKKPTLTDYFIHPSSNEEEGLNESLSQVRSYIENIEGDMDMICKEGDEMTGFGVFEGYETVGFVNEGNNCYQNSVIQVKVRVSVNGSVCFTSLHFSVS